MTKVIKREFEKHEDLKIKDVSVTYDTSLEVFNNEFNRLSGMDDDLFTYEVKVANILCDSNKDDDSEQRMSHEVDDDMGYDPFDIRGDDEVELTDEEFSDNEDEVSEVFRIDTNIFDFETPIKPAFNFIRPFGCPDTILNTIDHLGKFDGKDDEGFFVDALTKSINYKPVVVWNQSNGSTGTKACDDAVKRNSLDAGFKPSGEEEKKDAEDPGNKSGNPTEGKDSKVPSTEEPRTNQEKDDNINNTNNVNTASDGNNTNNVNAVSSTVNATGSEVNAVDLKISIELLNDPNMPELKDIVYSDDDEDVGAEADINNLDTHIPVIPIPTTRIHKDHPVKQIIRDIYSAPQTRRMTKSVTEQAMFSSMQQRTNHKDFMVVCFSFQQE
ncbi:hypothetical protein Tco_0132811 [Tanacetum coccineum]